VEWKCHPSNCRPISLLLSLSLIITVLDDQVKCMFRNVGVYSILVQLIAREYVTEHDFNCIGVCGDVLLFISKTQNSSIWNHICISLSLL
jgi:hypothetical protein